MLYKAVLCSKAHWTNVNQKFQFFFFKIYLPLEFISAVIDKVKIALNMIASISFEWTRGPLNFLFQTSAILCAIVLEQECLGNIIACCIHAKLQGINMCIHTYDKYNFNNEVKGCNKNRTKFALDKTCQGQTPKMSETLVNNKAHSIK